MSSESTSSHPPPCIDQGLPGRGASGGAEIVRKRKLATTDQRKEESESEEESKTEVPNRKKTKKASNPTVTPEADAAPTVTSAAVIPPTDADPALPPVRVACREHDIAALCAQFGSQPGGQSSSDSSSSSASLSSVNDHANTPAALRAKHVQHIQEFDWKNSLFLLRPADSTLHFRRIQRCISAWCLQECVQKLVADFNSTGNEEALIEFSSLHQQFLRMLTPHLNQFWAIITGSAKVVLAERLSVPCDDSSSTSDHSVQLGRDASSSKSNAAANRRINFVLRGKSCFRDAHADKFVQLWRFQPSKRGVGQIVLSSESLVDMWMASPCRRSCTSVVFDPSVPPSAANRANLTSGSTFNLWAGFRITCEKAIAAGKKISIRKMSQLRLAIAPFLDHIRIIWCREDEELYSYVLCVLASMIQRPWFKLGVALVLLGEEGAGKGIILTEFIAKIIGLYHYSHVTGLSGVCGSFNGSALATACVVFIDESATGSKLDIAKLKTLITEPTHILNNKYTPAVEVRSFTNFILASNSERAVEIDPKGRRFCVLQPDNRYCGTQREGRAEYFKKLLAVPVELVAMFLYQVDLTGFDPRQVPATDMQRTQKRLSLEKNGADLWLLRCIEVRMLPPASSAMSMPRSLWTAVPWDGHRSKAAVYEDYRSQAGSNPKAPEAFWKQLHAIVSYRTIQQKATMLSDACQLVCFPSLEECKMAFRNYMADPKWSFSSEVSSESNPVDAATAAVAAPATATPSPATARVMYGRAIWEPFVPTGPYVPLDARPSLDMY
jgi:hypothetical protein